MNAGPAHESAAHDADDVGHPMPSPHESNRNTPDAQAPDLQGPGSQARDPKDPDPRESDPRESGDGHGNDPTHGGSGAGQTAFEEAAAQYAGRSGVERRADGQIDVLKTVGGVRGLAESILPGVVFLVLFTVGRDLSISLISSLVVAAVFTGWRLIQRGPAAQAFSGLVGVAICAFVASRTGQAEDYYLVGFFTNAAYIVGMVVSILVKWPIAGLLFGFIRGEGLDWRKEAVRRRAYHWATWIIIAVMMLRLAVQVPLYLADNVVALGTTRLLMGVPLYAFGLWMAWLISRPPARGSDRSDADPSVTPPAG